jgi:hypothetical protein
MPAVNTSQCQGVQYKCTHTLTSVSSKQSHNPMHHQPVCCPCWSLALLAASGPLDDDIFEWSAVIQGPVRHLGLAV